MLPYTPLHALLMDELSFPIVVTSGNLSNEPICIDNDEALERLGDIADVFLAHDRPIERPIDDSVVQIVQDEIQVLRLARGYAPLSLELDESSPATLAVGAHLKSAICIGNERQIILSQHIGDLETPQTFATFQRAIKDFQHLYEIQPDCIAQDLHPDYLSTQYAQDLDRVWNPVQHHVAHVLSGMIDNDIKGDVLAVAWDGTGYGMDKTIWGGEWFNINRTHVERVAHLAPFPLPGGDIAVREPRRSALGALYATYGAAAFQLDITPIKHYDVSQRRILDKMLEKGFNAPQTSSMGRLFDVVASLLNLQQVTSFEGQAAMAVEFAAMKSRDSDSYPFVVSIQQVDWRPMIQALVEDLSRHTPTNILAARFLNTLVEMIVAVAHVIGEKQVLLTGGCFQNRLLTQGAINRLRQEGFTPYWHHQIPPNDGGIAVGQLAAVAQKINVRSDALCV
jgi:hydrogenase maturation protein HypF